MTRHNSTSDVSKQQLNFELIPLQSFSCFHVQYVRSSFFSFLNACLPPSTQTVLFGVR
jgi:hypothetical protein